jgi:hypothetical protein
MANKGWRRFRRDFKKSLRAEFTTAVWFATVILIPASLLIAVPFLFVLILTAFEIGQESAVVSGIGVSMTGFGTLVLSATENAERWERWIKQGRHGLALGLWLIASSLLRNAVWITVAFAVFTACVMFTASFVPAARFIPSMVSFGVSWLAGLFAIGVANAFLSGKKNGDGASFRGRRILSSKNQAGRLAKKKRWKL